MALKFRDYVQSIVIGRLDGFACAVGCRGWLLVVAANVASNVETNAENFNDSCQLPECNGWKWLKKGTLPAGQIVELLVLFFIAEHLGSIEQASKRAAERSD